MAGLIREQEFARPAAFSFADVEAQAGEIERAAQRRASEILASAHAQAERQARETRAAAQAAGEKAGHAEGVERARREAAEAALAEAREELERLRTALAAAVAGFEAGKRRLLAEAESGLIGLALAVARRVCKLTVAAGSDAALANARHVIELARNEADLVLQFHPREVEMMRAKLPELLRDIESAQHVEVAADDSVERGGCVLHGRGGRIDARIETQLDRLADVLLGREPSDGAPEANA